MPVEIYLPPKVQDQEEKKIKFDQMVVIGANGSGKTRFGSFIEENYENTHRISAQKSLSFPKEVSPKSKETAVSEFLYGSADPMCFGSKLNAKKSARWENNINTHLLNDFDKLLVLLHTEEYEFSLKYKKGEINKPITKLDNIKKIWEKIILHRELNNEPGTTETISRENPEIKYNASEMSDGERVIFYLAGEVLCAPDSSIIIIDEPELHLHLSLINTFFDLIEDERPDCSFIYLTHNIDFALSRQSAKKIWLKSYENQKWDYEILENESPIPEHLYLEILGSRNEVIFIEGDNNSIDYRLYGKIFPEHTLKPVGSCTKVISITKSFKEQISFHKINSYGLIDRDRRSDEDIMNLNGKDIWVLDVAEIENIFLIEEVVKSVAKHMGVDPEEVFSEVKSNIIKFFREEEILNNQIDLYFKEEFRKKLYELSSLESKGEPSLLNEISNKLNNMDNDALFSSIKTKFRDVSNEGDYNNILKLFNLKGAIIPKSDVCKLTTVAKQEDYINLVIYLIKCRDSDNYIKNGIISKLNK